MKKLLFIFLVSIFISCSSKMSVRNLSKTIESDIQQHYNEQGLGITVTGLTLIHREGNSYSGVLETREYLGEYYNYNVEVMYDGDAYTWEVY